MLLSTLEKEKELCKCNCSTPNEFDSSFLDLARHGCLLNDLFLYCIVEPGALPGFDLIDSRESKGIASPDLF